VDLAVEGEGEDRRLALVQEVQHHPLSGVVLHVDFHQVALDEKVTVTIPVESTGEAVGVKLGGVLEHVLFRTRVRGLPKDLPEVLTVDVSHLEMGQTIHLSELALPAGVDVIGDTGLPVFSVAAPRTEIVETPTGEEAAEELEATKEKKEAPAGEGSGDAASKA